jgi:hypothetical protein
MAYYRGRGVQAIHDGLIVMRRRSGKNWVRIEEVPKTPNGDLGELVLSTFAAHDLLLEMEADEKLLAIKPKAGRARETGASLQPGRRSLARRVADSSAYTRLSFPLEHATPGGGISGDLRRHPHRRAGGSGIRRSANAPLETVRRECLAMIRKLIERGFVVVAPRLISKAGL